MPKNKPLIAMACICENVLEDKDGVLSAIRIVDTFRLGVLKDLPSDAVQIIPLTLLLGLKSGEVTGSHEIDVRLKSPSGKVTELGRTAIRLAGGYVGANVVIKFNMRVAEMGVFWFDVLWGRDVLTSIPLKLEAANSSD